MDGKRMKDNAQIEKGPTEEENGSSTMHTAETLLRILPMALFVVALVIMFKDSQTNGFGSLYTILLLVLPGRRTKAINHVLRLRHILRSRPGSDLQKNLAAGAKSEEVLYLAYKGGTALTWSQNCGTFGGFCWKATTSIAITFIVTLRYACLTLISSYRLQQI